MKTDLQESPWFCIGRSYSKDCKRQKKPRNKVQGFPSGRQSFIPLTTFFLPYLHFIRNDALIHCKGLFSNACSNSVYENPSQCPMSSVSPILLGCSGRREYSGRLATFAVCTSTECCSCVGWVIVMSPTLAFYKQYPKCGVGLIGYSSICFHV